MKKRLYIINGLLVVLLMTTVACESWISVEPTDRLTEDEGFIDALPFQPYDLIADREDYRFQYRSHLAAALCSVAKAHPEKKDEIRERLRRYVEGKRFAVTMMGTGLRYDDTDTVLRMIDAL